MAAKADKISIPASETAAPVAEAVPEPVVKVADAGGSAKASLSLLERNAKRKNR